MLRGFPKKIKCIDCNKLFISNAPQHKRCGSRTKKTGCSYKARLRWGREIQEPKNRIKLKEYYKKYSKEWRKKQRKLNTDYAIRQKELRKKWIISEKGKLWSKLYRHKRIKITLENNRKRKLFKKGVKGSHTEKEWEACKEINHYCCVICGIEEKDIKMKYPKHLSKLTRDHIIPIIKGGTDYINNIQPLCVGCNARKHDK